MAWFWLNHWLLQHQSWKWQAVKPLLEIHWAMCPVSPDSHSLESNTYFIHHRWNIMKQMIDLIFLRTSYIQLWYSVKSNISKLKIAPLTRLDSWARILWKNRCLWRSGLGTDKVRSSWASGCSSWTAWLFIIESRVKNIGFWIFSLRWIHSI